MGLETFLEAMNRHTMTIGINVSLNDDGIYDYDIYKDRLKALRLWVAMYGTEEE